jgi:hypothetical protein
MYEFNWMSPTDSVLTLEKCYVYKVNAYDLSKLYLTNLAYCYFDVHLLTLILAK